MRSGLRALSTRVPPIAALPPPALEGQVAWVIGGIGVIGSGLVRGLLRAGATVVVNSRFPSRLEQLNDELGSPEKLVAINASLLPGHAESTIQERRRAPSPPVQPSPPVPQSPQPLCHPSHLLCRVHQTALEFTGGRLDHVVAHSAVRWWGTQGGVPVGGGLDEAEHAVPLSSSRVLDLSTEEYVCGSTQLPALHHCVARRLLPRLLAVPGTSYTFVTGGGNEDARSAIGQVNAQAVWGLAAALRNDLRDSEVKLREVRVGLKFNRRRAERLADPRERPLSHDLGAICAGIAASDERGVRPTHMLAAKDDCDLLKARFPVADQGYSVYFRSADML